MTMTLSLMRAIPLVLCLLLPLSAAEKLRVLMIGNSYTAQTRAEVKGFLDADPMVDVDLVAHCPGGKKLIEHLATPKVKELLADKGGWDVIVLQDQSQLPAFAMRFEGDALEQFSKGGEGMIRMAMEAQPKARLLLFETWARHLQPDNQGTLKNFDGKPEKMQEALTKAYELLRRNPGKWDFRKSVEVVPVGQVWQGWYRQRGYEDPSMSLHSGDRSHPGKLGAFLTGAVFYEAITGRAAAELPYQGKVGDADLALALKKQVRGAR
jgi:hypothetical protein